jgi:hypothetical protein
MAVIHISLADAGGSHSTVVAVLTEVIYKYTNISISMVSAYSLVLQLSK